MEYRRFFSVQYDLREKMLRRQKQEVRLPPAQFLPYHFGKDAFKEDENIPYSKHSLHFDLKVFQI